MEIEITKRKTSNFKGHNWGLCRKCGKDHGQNPALGKKRPNVSLRNKTIKMREATHLRSLGNTYGKANKGRIVSEESYKNSTLSCLVDLSLNIKEMDILEITIGYHEESQINLKRK